jgi:hypothetical protein
MTPLPDNLASLDIGMRHLERRGGRPVRLASAGRAGAQLQTAGVVDFVKMKFRKS